MGKKHKTHSIDTQTLEVDPMEENDAVQASKKKQKKNKKKDEEDHQRINIKIEVVNERPDKSLPVIGYFPSGYDPDKRAEEPVVKVLRNVKRKHRVKVVVKPNESSPVTFVGTNYSGEGAVPQMCTYTLGVFNKRTRTLKIVPIDSNKIFRLEPRIGDYDPAIDDAMVENEPTVEDNKPNFNFSTKKAEQSAKKERALRAYRGPEGEEDLNGKMADAMINMKALEVCAEASSIGRNVPPYDLSATRPQQAYPLEKIILKGEWQYLTDIDELLQQGKNLKTEGYPLFVCNRIHKIEEVKDEEVKESLACIFSYINHLIKFKDKNSKEGQFKDKKSKDGRSSEEHYKLPNILSQKFNDMFANTESRWLAGDKKDLLIRYVLVLALFVDDFKTDFTDIAKDLRMTTGALRTHFEYLGCRIVKQHNMTFAKLSAPLDFSKADKRRRRRR
ncbi:uncharacterized protein LOC143529264 isoform X1 [Bidens hawaiensis]|uniref:uncharacterized protein LOC143529264 isoform X1 n=1 Tax=Bidens hawaiensis TaxID=980011 RepID=UPI00404993C4